MDPLKMFLLLPLMIAQYATLCHGFAPRLSHLYYRIPRGSEDAPSSTSLFGIPRMFRWLTDQYPNINKRLQEGLTDDLRVDNFYLDMNGIIHPCTHGNAKDQVIVLDETEMFKKIFLYVDRLYKMVKPRHCLYLAVDGVAPRAKMNQQRSRRFRSAKEAEQTLGELIAQGAQISDKKKFDSNCITPGTDFMLKLSLAMQKWVQYKLDTDPFWQACGADVVLSGPDVPGEGEHKVMDFIRYCQQNYETEELPYEKGFTHVLYGLDADLIMLGLVTHEPRFMLLREKMSVVMGGRRRGGKKKDMMEYTKNDFEVLDLQGLRQLLAIEFRKFSDTMKNYSINRVVDDFIFLCMLVGNDFLPHMPHLEIENGILSILLNNYNVLLEEWGDYLTDKHKIHPDRLEHLLYHVAVYEEEHFKRRGYEENEPGWQLSGDSEELESDFYGQFYTGNPTPQAARLANKGRLTEEERNMYMTTSGVETTGPVSDNKKFRNKHPTDFSRSYRDFYYEEKLGWSPQDRNHTLLNRRAHVRDYLEGLHWVLHYYHNGCPAWDWYFPHLYSPLSTDMVNLKEFYTDCDEDGFCSLEFEEGEAIPSLAQLLSVLPPQSSDLLPKPLAELMMNPASPLLPFYPQDFSTDSNGKRQDWEAVVQIPFIDSALLMETVTSVLDKDEKQVLEGKEPLLTNSERRRNVRGAVHRMKPPKLHSAQEADELVSSMQVGARGARSYGRRGSAKGRGRAKASVPRGGSRKR